MSSSGNPKCSYGLCKKNSFVGFYCNLCQKNLCMRHRLPEIHNCSGLEKRKIEMREKLTESMPKITADKITKV